MVPGVVSRALLLIGLGIASSGCGAAGSAHLAGAADGGPSVGPGSTGTEAPQSPVDAAALPTECTTPVDQRPDGGTCILGATGHVLDFAGAPLANLVMTFCGAACYGTRSDSSGGYVIYIGDYLTPEDYALHADGRPDHGVDYLRMTKSEPAIVAGVTMRLPTLPPSTVELPPDKAPASSITVGDLTLSIPDGTTFKLDDED